MIDDNYNNNNNNNNDKYLGDYFKVNKAQLLYNSINDTISVTAE